MPMACSMPSSFFLTWTLLIIVLIRFRIPISPNIARIP
jgi:hypothetical protein